MYSTFGMQMGYFLQILLAIILGAILGLQRELWGKWAGPRTYALVTAGSALFTLLSLKFFGTNTAAIAAGVVTGIGFLGAGTILHKESRVVGLTTAAGMWMSAAIGMSVGARQYFLAIATTFVIFVVLMFDDSRFKKNLPVHSEKENE